MAKPLDALSSYDDTYLLCRDIRHSWTVQGYFVGADSYGSVYKRRLMCSRCHTVRIDTLTGYHPTRYYQYPDDYHLKGVKLGDVREEAINRTKSQANIYNDEQELLASLKPRRSRRGKG